MDAPLQAPSLLEKYDTLKGLFPGWKGAGTGQGAQRQSSTGTPPQNQGQQQHGTPQMSTQPRPPMAMQPMMPQQLQSTQAQQPQLNQSMGMNT